ncbi:MAG: hypothetical protein WC343_13955, partial [Bacilli bacterium]
DELEEAAALDLILRHQSELKLTSSQIKKWANKSYLTLITFDNAEKVESYKIKECDYINMNDWITLDKKDEN